MKPFDRIINEIPFTPSPSLMMALMQQGYDSGTAEAYLRKEHEAATRDVYTNGTYTCIIRDAQVATNFPEMKWLSAKRIDKKPITWEEMQEIKNLLFSNEHEAIELFPAESRRVNSGYTHYLWVLKSDSIRFPFGFAGK